MVFDLVVNKNNIPRTLLQFKVRLTPRFPAVRTISNIEPTVELKKQLIAFNIKYNIMTYYWTFSVWSVVGYCTQIIMRNLKRNDKSELCFACFRFSQLNRNID